MNSMIRFGNTQSEGCDQSHPPSYKYSMIVFGNAQSENQKVHIQLASLGRWVKLLYMGNSTFDPSLPLSYTLPPLMD
jgi:hypothetical protein